MDNHCEDEESLLKNSVSSGNADSGPEVDLVTKQKIPIKWFHQRRTVVVEPLLMLYTVAIFVAHTVEAQFRYQKIGQSMGINLDNLTHGKDASCDTNVSDPGYLEMESVQKEAARWNIYIEVATNVPSIFMTILYGSYSDKIGRKIILLLPPIGLMVAAAVNICIIHFDLPVYVFLLTSLQSFFGGSNMMIAACFAYIADTTTHQARAFRMTLLDVILMSAASFAQLGLGYWIKAQGFFPPYMFVLGAGFISLLYGIFLVPESKPKTQNAQKNTAEYLTQGYKLCIKADSTGRRWKINMILLSYVVGNLGSTFDVMTLYEMNTPLCWKSVLIGYYEAASMMTRCLATLAAVVIFERCMKMREESQAISSHVSSVLEYVYLVFVKTTAMMFIGNIFCDIFFS